MMNPHYKVFISYAHVDRAYAVLLPAYIKSIGGHAFLDAKDLTIGVRFSERIIQEIRSSDELLLLMSPEFKTSRWLDREVGIAYGAGVPVYPILHRMAKGEANDIDFLSCVHAGMSDEFLTHYCPQLRQRILAKPRVSPAKALQENVKQALQQQSD